MRVLGVMVRLAFTSSSMSEQNRYCFRLDCDKEGENICYEVINAVAHKMQRSTRGDPIYRAHFSAITQKDITQVKILHFSFEA